MTVGDFFSKSDTVLNNSDLVIDGSSSGTGAVEIHTIAVTASHKIIKEVDTTGDGTFDISIEIDNSDVAVHSQKNKIELSLSENIRLRVVNTSGGSQSIHVTGIEIAS